MKPEKPSLKERWRTTCNDLFDLVFLPIFCVFALLLVIFTAAATLVALCAYLNP